MTFKNLCVLVLWTNVASALEGLNLMSWIWSKSLCPELYISRGGNSSTGLSHHMKSEDNHATTHSRCRSQVNGELEFQLRLGRTPLYIVNILISMPHFENFEKFFLYGLTTPHQIFFKHCSDWLTLVLLVTILCQFKMTQKKHEKWPKPWHMGTRGNYPMNTNMTRLKCFSKIFSSLCFGHK